MKVVSVKVKQFQSLHDFEANTNGNVILFRGDNGLGKSTLIRLIEIALGKCTNIPINTEGEGEVFVQKGEHTYKIEVKVKDGKSKLRLIGPDNIKADTKSAIADLIGAIDFNPEEFVEMSKTDSGRKKQIEEVKKLFPQEFLSDIAKWERDVQARFNERTDLGRDLKKAEGAIQSHALYKSWQHRDHTNYLVDTSEGKIKLIAFAEFQRIDTNVVFEQLQGMQAFNNKRAQVEQRIADRAETIKKNAGTIDRISNEIEELENELQNKIAKAKEDLEIERKVLETNQNLQAEAAAWIRKNPPQDTSILQTRLEQANDINKKVDSIEAFEKLLKEKAALEDNTGTLTTQIEQGRECIRNAVREAAALIMPGLEFNDDQLLYNGIPVSPDSLSTSEIMELGMRLKFHQNPEAPIFLQSTGEIGKKRWETILAFAKEHGLQIIGEEVVRGQEQLTIEIIEE